MNGSLLHKIYQPDVCLSEQEIRDYLEGNASREDLRRVENHLLDCPLCSDAVNGVEMAGLSAIPVLENFSAFKKKLPELQEAKTRRLTPGKFMARAAAIAAIFVLGAVAYINLSQAPRGDKLFAEYFSSYENDIPLTRSGEDTAALNPAFAIALNDYSSRRFSRSIANFEKAIAEEPGNDAAHFFAGMACLESSEWEKACQHLEGARKSGGAYASKAAWYLALAYLKMEKREEAKVVLEEFAKAGGSKAGEAKQLLAKL
ncbi:MAG: hypothetical protein H6577_03560 [Lewinellaceae bacterium]|nr:hypothetical protein [Lewinellaceae bacterium]